MDGVSRVQGLGSSNKKFLQYFHIIFVCPHVQQVAAAAEKHIFTPFGVVKKLLFVLLPYPVIAAVEVAGAAAFGIAYL